MRIARALMLLAIATIAVMALPMTTASAQQFEVSTEEPAAEHCDPCHFWIHGEEGLSTTITQHNGGMETVVTACHDELEGVIGEGGEGAFTSINLTGPVGTCFLVPCADAGGQIPWPFHLVEHGPGGEELEYTICLFGADGSFNFCTISTELTDEGAHHYELRAISSPCHGPGESPNVEFDGHWLLNGEHDHPDGHNFEIVHL